MTKYYLYKSKGGYSIDKYEDNGFIISTNTWHPISSFSSYPGNDRLFSANIQTLVKILVLLGKD